MNIKLKENKLKVCKSETKSFDLNSQSQNKKFRMNRISQIIKEKGIEELRPSQQILDRLGIKIRTWNAWVDNEKDPELVQLPVIAEFLNCTVADLIHQDPVRHGS